MRQLWNQLNSKKLLAGAIALAVVASGVVISELPSKTTQVHAVSASSVKAKMAKLHDAAMQERMVEDARIEAERVAAEAAAAIEAARVELERVRAAQAAAAKRARAERASRARVTVQPQVQEHSDGFPAVMLRIRYCESRNNYTAQNRSSTASGAWQFLDSSWAKYAGYPRAYMAPPHIQDQKAMNVYNAVGTRPWSASRSCWS